MKGLIIFCLLCTLAVQQTVLFSSSASNTVLIFPSGQTTVSSIFHESSAAFANYIGLGAHWVYKSGPDSWPTGNTATFKAQFYADCTLQGTLVIAADNVFSASLNGGPSMSGNDLKKKYSFPVRIECGLNTLVITVTNLDVNSPGGVIFAVTQNQDRCYQCQGPLSYYNRDTCSCECIDGCKCSPISTKFTWQPYPVCGCTCTNVYKCADNQYWDDRSCSCKCKKVLCPPGQFQDMKSCNCIKCLLVSCKPPLVWSSSLCKCVGMFEVAQEIKPDY